MTKQNIIENNKLIAEFMGLEENAAGVSKGYFIGLGYHSSWDKLIPVLEKIKDIFKDNVRIIISFKGCSIAIDLKTPNEQRTFTKIGISLTSNLLKDTYKIIVEFIKWYNKKNKES